MALVPPCVLVGPSAFADTARGGPMRVVVRVQSADDQALYHRLRGQVAGLDVQFTVVEDPPREVQLQDQLATADHLADQHAASVVLWFDFDRGNVRLYVAEAGAGKLYVRTLSTDDTGPRGRSATLESVAVVARGALRALSEGGTIGVSRESLTTPPPAPSASSASPPSLAPPPTSPRVAPSSVPSVQRPLGKVKPKGAKSHERTDRAEERHAPELEVQSLWFTTGYRATVSGVTRPIEHAMQVEVGLAGRRWQAGLGAWIAPPTSFLTQLAASEELTSVSVTRWVVPASFALRVWDWRVLTFGLGFEGGPMFVTRRTKASPGNEDIFVRKPDNTLATVWLGADFRVGVRPAKASFWVLEGRFGAGFVPMPIVLGHDVATGAPYADPATFARTYQRDREYQAVEPYVQVLFEYVRP